MIFNNSSATKPLQETLIVPTLFVLAQAERNKATVSFEQLTDAVTKIMMPASEEEAQRMKRAIFELMAKKELVKSGLASLDKAKTSGPTPMLTITERGMAVLGRRFVDMIDAPNLSKDLVVSEEASRNLEKSLLIPMLLTLVKMHEEFGLPVKMGQWREGTKRMLNLSPEDLGALTNRSDTKIDQVMRNIKSHNTMNRNGWVLETNEGYIPSQKGMARLAAEFLSVLPAPNFGEAVDEQPSEEQQAAARPRMRHA